MFHYDETSVPENVASKMVEQASDFPVEDTATNNMPKHEQTEKGLVLKKNFLDVIELIRSIQRAEGNPDCFRRSNGYCDQLDCAWRPYCLEKYNTSSHEPARSK